MFRLHEGSIKKEEVVEFLKALKAHLKQPLLIIWDGLKAHCQLPAYRIHLIAGIKEPGYSRHIGASGCAA